MWLQCTTALSFPFFFLFMILSHTILQKAACYDIETAHARGSRGHTFFFFLTICILCGGEQRGGADRK